MRILAENSSFFILPHYYRTGFVREFVRYAPGHGVGGTSMDYYVDSGIPYSYTIELPDFGQFGMLMPASMISMVRKPFK